MSRGDIMAGRAFVEIGIKDVGLTKGLQNASAMLKSFGQSTQAVGATMAQAGMAVTALGATLGTLLAIPVKAAASWEGLAISFETMTGSASKAKAMLSDISRFAVETPFQTGELAESAKMMLAFGYSTEQIMPALKQLGDLASGVGAPIQDLTYLMATSRASGRVYARDILQFANRGIPVASVIAENLGKTTAEIMDMTSKGEISFEHLEAAIAKMVGPGGRFFDLMKKQSASTLGMFSTMMDEVTLAARTFGETLLPVAKAVTEFATGVAKSIGAWVEKNQGLATTIAAAIVGVTGFGAALTAVGAAVAVAGTAISGIGTALGVVASAAAFAMTPVGILTAGLAALGAGVVGSFALVAAQSQAFRDTVADSVGQITSIFTTMGGAISDALAAGDIDLAWRIAFAGIRLSFVQLLVEMGDIASAWAQNVGKVIFKNVKSAFTGGASISLDSEFLAKTGIGAAKELLALEEEAAKRKAARDAASAAAADASALGTPGNSIGPDGKLTNKEIFDRSGQPAAAPELTEAAAAQIADAAGEMLSRLAAGLAPGIGGAAGAAAGAVSGDFLGRTHDPIEALRMQAEADRLDQQRRLADAAKGGGSAGASGTFSAVAAVAMGQTGGALGEAKKTNTTLGMLLKKQDEIVKAVKGQGKLVMTT